MNCCKSRTMLLYVPYPKCGQLSIFSSVFKCAAVCSRKEVSFLQRMEAKFYETLSSSMSEICPQALLKHEVCISMLITQPRIFISNVWIQLYHSSPGVLIFCLINGLFVSQWQEKSSAKFILCGSIPRY